MPDFQFIGFALVDSMWPDTPVETVYGEWASQRRAQWIAAIQTGKSDTNCTIHGLYLGPTEELKTVRAVAGCEHRWAPISLTVAQPQCVHCGALPEISPTEEMKTVRDSDFATRFACAHDWKFTDVDMPDVQRCTKCRAVRFA